ncbi:MAG: hypothetical protein ABH821_02665 [archaeon]
MKMEDKTIFVEFFGDTPAIRIIDFLLLYDIFDYSKKDICKNADVSWNTLEKLWDNIEKNEIVKNTRKIGKSKMYKLNTENPAVKQLIELNKKLIKLSIIQVQEEPEKEKIKVTTHKKRKTT